jgi:hypothetical protein
MNFVDPPLDVQEHILLATAETWEMLRWFTAASHLYHYLLPEAINPSGTTMPFDYGPTHSVSLEAKVASCDVPFSLVKQEVEAAIRSRIPVGLCRGDALPAISGTCKRLSFYNCPFTHPDIFLAFGGMQSGRYALNNVSILPGEKTVTVRGVVDYFFGDHYVYDPEDAGKTILDRFGRNLYLAGWASAFDTSIHIQDAFEVTLDCPGDPDPPGDPHGGGGTGVQTSVSPEDKWGPPGSDLPGTAADNLKRYVQPGQIINYRVEIWNKPEAPVPTQDATIDDVLDPTVFDLGTFEFTRVGFLKWDRWFTNGPAPLAQTRIDARPDMGIAVDVIGTLNPDTGQLHWWFHTLDPMTGDYPEDPTAGFLPPYNPATGYEIGWVEYQVSTKSNLHTGTVIANQALVQFDFLGPFGPAPKDGLWVNTIDAGLPSSHVLPLPGQTRSNVFLVSWQGTDDAGGSGVASYAIYVQRDSGPWQVWLQNTSSLGQLFIGECGHTYAFYSVARDNVGNREAAVAAAQAQIYLLPNTPPLLHAITNRVIAVGQSLRITNVSDPDPGQTVTFSLAPGAPAGMGINPATGLLTWNPLCVQGGSSNVVTVLVTDDGCGNRFIREVPVWGVGGKFHG